MEDTNSAQETLRTYLQLQEQLHATQLAIDRNRREIDASTAQNAEVMAGQLQNIEKALATQRAQELRAMQSSNQVMLIVAGTFAAMGFVAMLLMAYFQWRTVSRLAEMSAAFSAGRALGNGRGFPAIGSGEAPIVSTPPDEQPNTRIIDAVERLEKRILELEHTSHPPLHEPYSNGNGLALGSAAPNEEHGQEAATQEEPAAPEGAEALLGKGQSLLNLDKAEEALACFEQAIELEPQNAEALVKKGTALERLRKLNEAIACYDQAIAADGTMTIAYLYKGGLFNRMERFTEALECYERALRTQEKRG
jgi:tetratricopeptide (TPR) repeat protein